MGMRDDLKQLDASVQGDQRERMKELLSEESWTIYERLSGDDIEDEDEYKLAVLQFGLSLSEPDAFKALLTDEQRSLLEGVENELREEMGL